MIIAKKSYTVFQIFGLASYQNVGPIFHKSYYQRLNISPRCKYSVGEMSLPYYMLTVLNGHEMIVINVWSRRSISREIDLCKVFEVKRQNRPNLNSLLLCKFNLKILLCWVNIINFLIFLFWALDFDIQLINMSRLQIDVDWHSPLISYEMMIYLISHIGCVL